MIGIQFVEMGKWKVLQEDEVLSILHKELGEKNFRLLKFEIKPASGNTMGFLGEHYKLMAEAEVEGRPRQFSYFVKKIPTEVPQHLDYALKTRAFYKEVELYKTLFEDFRAAQSRASEPTKWRPEFFYSRGEEVIVLEDLTAAGFYMCSGRSFMDEEHARACLKALAAMHAASLVFESRFAAGEVRTLSPNAGSSLGEIYHHLTFETEASDEEGHPGNTYHEAGIASQLKIADLLPRYSAREKQIVREKLPDVLRHSYQLVKPSKRFKNVFVHGDLWSNNVLFRKSAAGEVEAVILDFQLARYAPPAHDVMMFLHLVQSKKFREERQEELLRFYFLSLSRELQKNGVRVEEVLPWETFLESCDFYQDLGLICKLFYFQLILAPEAIANKFLSTPELFTKNMLKDRSEMVVESFLGDESCRERVTEALEEVIDKFILV